MLFISELYIYPIKSLGGISLSTVTVTDRAFLYDRRWMLIDKNNSFVSQRKRAEMALLKVELEEAGLKVTHSVDGASIIIPYQPASNELIQVSIWDDTCTAQYVNDEADKWFSAKLDLECRLVFMPDDTRRIVDQRYAPENSITSFSDAYPFLMIGEASLKDLNTRLNQNLNINRFRPNIVFSGGDPFLEDKMQSFTVNDISFYGVKLCARCPIITIDQSTALKTKEPLKKLATYRTKNHKVYFGQNLINEGLGKISVGDTIENLKYHTEERFFINAVV